VGLEKQENFADILAPTQGSGGGVFFGDYRIGHISDDLEPEVGALLAAITVHKVFQVPLQTLHISPLSLG
jgi:hypothetical protein